ncbi:hypothetical protein LRS74_18530 [Streptomyces sp. LX-29]|uniref:hypothetical protein n=1 Tax=Streptomyces sp. LX-29 TaxID=2900152 RepID=UPI00240DE207|nr:hypothetical protein [Streptomyces sp. LX-29]WFB08816.1 hypothetical protein LRS74_18530 [Streptomyces sp. LX-29]
MSVPMPRVAAFAAAASFVPWGVGASLCAAVTPVGVTPYEGQTAAEARREAWASYAAEWFSPEALLLPVLTFLALVALQYVGWRANRWLIAAKNVLGYAGVLALVTLVQGIAAGDERPEDWVFFMLTLALLTLQLPACYLVSAAMAKPFETAAHGGVARGRV